MRKLEQKKMVPWDHLGSLSQKGSQNYFQNGFNLTLVTPWDTLHHWLTHWSPKTLIRLGHGVIQYSLLEMQSQWVTYRSAPISVVPWVNSRLPVLILNLWKLSNHIFLVNNNRIVQTAHNLDWWESYFQRQSPFSVPLGQASPASPSVSMYTGWPKKLPGG